MRVQALVCIFSMLPGTWCETPIALAGDEDRRHIDRATGKELELGRVDVLGSAAIPLQAALEAGPRIFAAVDLELVFGEPRAGGDLLRRGHMRRHGLGHPLVEIHDVVARHLGELFGRETVELERLVAAPIGALVVVVGAQEGVHALRAVAHVGIRLARRIIPLVMLTRTWQGGERLMDIEHRRRARAEASRSGARVPKGRLGGPEKGALISATERKTSGLTRAHQAATGEPKSWPTTAATSRRPSAATRPSTSLARLRRRKERRSPS